MISKKGKDINQRQKEFYDAKKKNLPTKLWSYFRNGELNRIKKRIGVEKEIYDLHIKWLGNLSDKKVLDLGCYAGNQLSMRLAKESASYVGIDLSPKGIDALGKRIKDIPGARVQVVDFLSDDFSEKNFDIIYAYGVLHHFKDTDELIHKLKEKLSSQGYIISHDPLKTSFPVKIIRALYRPFQTDKDWEWPFTKRTYYKFDKAFDIKERRAVLGKTKWTSVLNLLPLSENKKLEKGKLWHHQDWEKSSASDSYMFTCMHLSILMQNKQ